MEIIGNIASNIGILVGVLILHRAGVLKTLLNGKNGSIESQLKMMQDNHLHAIQEGIDEIKSCNKDIKSLLQEVIKYGVICRKKDE